MSNKANGTLFRFSSLFVFPLCLSSIPAQLRKSLASFEQVFTPGGGSNGHSDTIKKH